MTREEALRIVEPLKWVILDARFMVAAGWYEDVELRLHTFSVQEIHQFADFVLPRGRRGRVMLVLRDPYEARALAFLAALLRSIEE